MSLPGPSANDYDAGLGIDCGAHVNYIKESHVIQSRISSIPCYVLRPRGEGQSVGYDTLLPLNDYVDTSPNYRAQAWPSGSLVHPSTNPETNNQQGDIYVYIDSVLASRVMEVDDLLSDDEFAVVDRIDRSDKRIEIVFNEGFDSTVHAIEWKYTTMNEGISNTMLKRGSSDEQSLFGWLQYTNNCYDTYQGRHQILVRMPLVLRDLVINEEGKVVLEEKESWMIWAPYVKDFDILVVPADNSPSGEEMRFEIVNKRDSVIQNSLTSQRFKLKYLEPTDDRYGITIYASGATVPVTDDFVDSVWVPLTP